MFALLAQSRLPAVPDFRTGPSTSGAARDLILVLGASLLVGLALIVWVKLRSLKRERRHSHRREKSARHPSAVPPPPGAEATEEPLGDGSEPDDRVSRRRRKRRDHRMRNPTLAETGGLPPARSKDIPPAAL